MVQPETRFGQEHLKILGPEMMMMKRTKPRKKLKDNTVSQSGKSQAPQKHDLVVKVAGGSPNYMKDTTSSEARKEKKKMKRFNLSRNQKNQTSLKHDSRYGVNKPSFRGFTKAPSFKRCSQRATCSSTLKDSKFPEYLMLKHGETHDEVNGTSVLKVCPYKYCSLNGHLQYPPLKSFISSKRQSLKSQKCVKMEEYVEMDLEEKKECENGNEGTFEVDIETQISETVSEGAPSLEIDSDEYSDTAEMVRFSEGDHGTELKEFDLEETLVDDSVKEKTLVDDSVKDDSSSSSCEVDVVAAGAPCSETKTDDYSDSVEIVRFSEGEHGNELKESDLEETLVDDSLEEVQEKVNMDKEAESGCFSSEVIGMVNNTEADEDDAGEETLKDKAEDCKEECQDGTEVISMMVETAKVPYNRKQKPCNQEVPEASISWTIIKCKKPIAETENLREFNPREPNYLPIVAEADSEKVDLKHQDMDERKNSEDWMFDYALQRAVTKLSSARKRKVALLVEAFETVQPVMPHSTEPTPVLSYGRHLQACN